MAAAYAALVSLMNTLDQIQIHPPLSTYFKKYPIKSVRERIDFLVDFVEKFSSDAESCGEAEDLVRRIAVLAHEAEYSIELHASYCVRNRKLTKEIASEILQSKDFLLDLQKKIDDMDSIKVQIIKETGNHHQLLLLHLARYFPCLVPPASCLLALLLPPASSSAPPPTPMVDKAQDLVGLEADEIIQVQPADPISDEHSPNLVPDMQNKVIKAKEETGSINQQITSSSSSPAKTNRMVGFDGYLEQLLDQLTRQHSGSRQILPIVGMGGIGKTTLARNVYDNLLIVEHFYVRAWVTVSQEFSASEILLQALSCLRGSTSKTDKTDDQLGEELHKILYGRRYLIVLDDIWSVEAWDKMKFFFPENNDGSRIVITTRQSELVGYFGTSALAVDFLDDKNSWELFCEKTFAHEGCPPELEDVGHEIVRKCEGLPLAIVIVGGLLGKSPKTPEYWKEIAKDKRLVFDSEEGNKASGILYLSYKHMPIWLKSCFLYFGLFPEDYLINVSRLIKLWVAEGIIKSNTDQSLEEVAEHYVNELVDRNLVLVGALKLNKKPKTCYVHDVVRDLCVRIAEKENFYCVQRDIDGKHHFIVDERTARFYDPEYHTTIQPSLLHPEVFSWRTPVTSNFRLLRVVFRSDTLLHSDHGYSCFGEVSLRLLVSETSYYMDEIPPSVSRLWSLQTLIIVVENLSVTAPREIWEMLQLRHINIKRSVCLPPTPPGDDVSVLQNLQTLEIIENPILTEEVCKRIPNIKKLGIYCDREFEEEKNHLHNVEFLNKLESLLFSCFYWSNAGDFFRNHKLPSSLKKLTLERCELLWSDMAMIASLPHLQTLNLLNDAVRDKEWNCVEWKFRCLKHLQISDCFYLTHWIADESSFPMLETLSLEKLSLLKEIPSGIGDVPTLEKLSLFECRKSTALSAVKILEEQESLANLGLSVQIVYKHKSEAKELQQEIEELDITCENLRIYGKWDE